MTYPDGAIYEGNFIVGKRHGYGKETYTDGTILEGFFVNGHLYNIYEGDSVDGKPSP